MSERPQADGATERDAEEAKAQRPAGRKPDDPHPTPLFLRDASDGAKGNAQDEKDEMAE
jgi:hypothetical protein